MTPAHLGNANAHMSTEERAQVLRWLEESHREFFAEIDSVSDDQWNWKPAPERWSVGETHLALKEFTLAHPFPVFGTLNAYQWLIYVPLHTLRHNKQIAELKVTPGYRGIRGKVTPILG